MKKINILLLFLISSVLLGQNTIPDSSLSFYPLEVGNYWEYNVYYGSDPIHVEYGYSFWKEVVGDTMLGNGKQYKVLAKGNFYDSRVDKMFERIDSSNTSVYRYENGIEYKIDSLASEKGDTIKCSRFTNSGGKTYCTDIIKRLIYDEEITVKYFNDFQQIPNVNYQLAKNIGLIANYA